MTTLQALSLRQPIQPAPESTPTASNLTPDRITVLFSETVPGRTNDIVLFRKWFSPEPPLSLHEYLEVVILPKIDSNIDDYPRYAADIRAVFRGIGSDNGIVKLKMICQISFS